MQPELERLRAEHADVLAHLTLLESGSVISSHDEPAQAVRSKRDSSIVVGARAVAEGRAQAFVSAGSTGGMLAAGLLVVKRVPGVKRPAIVTVLPGDGRTGGAAGRGSQRGLPSGAPLGVRQPWARSSPGWP